MQSLLNGTELGAYTIIRLIGRGGMGEVYEAYEKRLQRRVAIKVISADKAGENGDGDVVRRFLQEARTLAQVNHPNIVTIYAIDKINDTQFIAMEFVDGALLKDIFSLFVLSADEAAPMFIQMLEGLRALHENKILHRDLKPHNLILRANGQIKIFDFGIAKREGDHENEKTTVGVVVGTLAYLPPEVLFGSPASARSDLWSLGAIFYECLTGQPLVSLHNIKIKGVRASADSEVIFPSETLAWVPEEMRQIIARLCDKEPQNRYPNASMVIEDLKRFQAARPLVAPNVFNSLAKSVNNIAALKAKIDPRASREPKIKRALALAQITGATSISAEPEAPLADDVRVITSEVKDSVTGRRRARKARRKKKQSQGFWTQAIAGLVVVALLGLLWLKIRPSGDGIMKFHDSTPVTLAGPYDHQNLWLDAIQTPAYSWSRAVDVGEYELQVAVDGDDANILSSDPIQGKSLHSDHTLPEGKYQWRLVPMRGQADPGPPHHFTISYLTRIELLKPDAMQMIDVPSLSKPGTYTTELKWKCKLGAVQYRVQIFPAGNHVTPLSDFQVRECGVKDVSLSAGAYDWQVRVEDPSVARGSWSELRRLTLHVAVPNAEPASVPAAAAVPTPAPAPVATPVAVAKPAIDFASRVPQLRNLRIDSTLQLNSAPPVLRWLPVKGAEAYELQIFAHGDSNLPMVSERLNETEFTWAHPTPGTHFWNVRAIDASGLISKPSARGRLEMRLPAPAIATNAKGQLAWNSVPLAEKYIVQSSPAQNMDGATESVTEKTQFKIASTKTRLYVRVAAAGSDGRAVSEYSPVNMVEPAVADLAAGPVLLTPPQGAKPRVGKSGRISVLFSWEKVAEAVSYRLEIASDPGFKNLIDHQDTHSHGYLMKEAQLQGPVYWRVRAILPHDREPASNISSWSATRDFEVH